MVLQVPCGSPNRESELEFGEDLTDIMDNQDGDRIVIYNPCDDDQDFDSWGG